MIEFWAILRDLIPAIWSWTSCFIGFIKNIQKTREWNHFLFICTIYVFDILIWWVEKQLCVASTDLISWDEFYIYSIFAYYVYMCKYKYYSNEMESSQCVIWLNYYCCLCCSRFSFHSISFEFRSFQEEFH